MIDTLETPQKRPPTRAETFARVAVVVVLALFVWVWWRESTRVDREPADLASIAVLPFTDLSAGGADQYLGDGIAEALIRSLNQVRGVRVAAQTSAFSFRGKDVDVQDVGAKLGVLAVLQGTVQRDGDSLHITMRLVNVSDDHVLLSQTHELAAPDLLAAQNTIAVTVTSALTKTEPQLGKPTTASGTGDARAYDLYMQARFSQNKRTAADLQHAIDLFEQTVARDSLFAAAWSDMAEAYTALAQYADVPATLTLAKARAASNRANALDAEHGEGLTSRGYLLLTQDWNARGADSVLHRASRLLPNDAQVSRWLGDTFYARGQRDSALAAYHRAVVQDPLSAPEKTNVAMLLGELGDSTASQRELDEALALNPNDPLALRFAVYTYFAQRDSAKLFAAYETYLHVSPRAGAPIDRLRDAWMQGGPNAVIQVQIGSLSVRSLWVESAMWRALAKDYDGVFRDMEFALRARSVWLPVAASVLRDPAITADPRWATLRARMRMNN